MADLIERSAVERIIRNHRRECSDYGKILLTNLSIHVDEVPAVDAVPVRHGRWIRVVDNNGQHQVCEFCGEWKYHSNQKFCGECGAVMDGKDGNDGV